MSNSTSLQSLAADVPILRGFVHQVSPYFTGSVLENRLGLQVYRTMGKHFAWLLRKKRVNSEIKTALEVLERDGVLAIPDFLHLEQYQLVKEEFEKLEPELTFGPFRETTGGRIDVANLKLRESDKNFPSIRQFLQSHPLLLALASAAIRRTISSPPQVAVSVYRRNDPAVEDNDIENVLHADLHAPTIKAFYYLNEINESNGAFVYAKGSHKFSLNRLRHEYDISVRAARLERNGVSQPSSLIAERGPNKRPMVSDTLKERMAIKETSLCGRANTLVVTNNMGFHRRGEFTGDAPRKTILLNFRHLERCF